MGNLTLKSLIIILLILVSGNSAIGQDKVKADSVVKENVDSAESLSYSDSLAMAKMLGDMAAEDEQGGHATVHKVLKEKFVSGNAGFMSLVAMALILGLSFCIERIIYLTLSDVDDRKLMQNMEKKVQEKDIEGAKDLCRDTRGPIASVCYLGLMYIDNSMEEIERSLQSYGNLQVSKLERGCSWITLFIAIAPSLGFLGTVIGMVMAFDQIQQEGDISPTIVAAGMKVALITTIFGIIVALILQVFYNYILSKIEHLTYRMEEDAIALMDIIEKYKKA